MPLPPYQTKSGDTERPPSAFTHLGIVVSLTGTGVCFLVALAASMDGGQGASSAIKGFVHWDSYATLCAFVGSVFGSNAVNKKAKQTHPGIYGLAWANFLTFAFTGGLLAFFAFIAGASR